MRLVLLIMVGLLSLECLASLNRAVANPTSPPSRDYLVRNPSSRYTNGNLPITGHVAGGKHFRGTIPYHASTDFTAPMGSSYINSFLRQSAGNNMSGSSGRYVPYYLRSSQVTKINPHNSRLIAPLDLTSSGTLIKPRKLDIPSLAPKKMQSYQLSAKRYVPKQRDTVLSTGNQLTNRLKQPSFDKTSVTANRKKLMTQLEQDLLDIKQNAENMSTIIKLQKDKTQPTNKKQQPTIEDLLSKKKQSDKKALSSVEFKKQLEDLLRQKQLQSQSEEEIKTLQTVIANLNKQIGKDTADKELSHFESKQQSLLQDEIGEDTAFEKIKAQINMASGPKNNQFGFSDSMAQADKYLTSGKFYLANHSYSKALIYKPHDSAAYRGKALALFAAGEYCSSSLFLAWSIESVGFVEKIDLSYWLTDRDKLDNHFVDLSSWIRQQGSPKLSFLQSYLYYQDGQLQKSLTAINLSLKAPPEQSDSTDSPNASQPAKLLLKSAIESTISAAE